MTNNFYADDDDAGDGGFYVIDEGPETDEFGNEIIPNHGFVVDDDFSDDLEER